MSLIGNLDGELWAVTTGVGRASQLTAQAGDVAGQIASRAIAFGFAGIGQRVAYVGDAIQQLGGQLTDISQAVDGVRGPIGQASDQTSSQDMINVLGPVRQRIAAVQDAIGVSLSRLDEIRHASAAALRGGQPEPMLARLDAIRQVLVTAAQRGQSAQRHLETALAQARHVGEGGQSASGAGVPALPSAGDTPGGPTQPDQTVRDSRGRLIPSGVRRLPSGRYPANFQYAGRVYDGPRWTTELAETYPNGVRFTDDGFPDFEPYAEAKASFEPHFDGDRRSDEDEANRKAGLTETPLHLTWHHRQDTKTMLLVPSDLHDAIRHAGGVSIMKGRT